MTIKMHPNYARLMEIARQSHENGRAPIDIAPEDIALARLYSYAFRRHVIGAFHATQLAIRQLEMCDPLTEAYCQRAVELLIDLANRTMDPVGDDFRALISTFHHYATNIERVVESLSKACDIRKLESIRKIRNRFVELMEEISTGNGIHTTQDTHAPEQASFIVPNLGIPIVPLVYGDYHSWNLAYLDEERSDVPFHLHQEGVEIHLGYSPMHGYTIHGDCYALVDEGYAMPVPKMTRHGYVNLSTTVHHVPFIFGSLKHGGWGVFFDVVPKPIELDQLQKVQAISRQMDRTVLLEREISTAAAKFPSVRYPIIPASVTDRDGTGGLELSVARVNERGLTLRTDHFCIVSVVQGRGVVRMASVEKTIGVHDHFGVPVGIPAFLWQEGKEPLVTIDAVIKRGRSVKRY